MIRWYDYVAAFVFADLISWFLILGFSATFWWEPFVFGGAAGYLWRSWNDFYCKFRLHQEIKNGQ